MRVFDLSDIAAIVRMPKARVRNWTVGRPLKIASSLNVSRRPGSRNLYSLQDVYLIALVNELWKAGMTKNALVRVLKEISSLRSAIEDEDAWGLVLHMRGKKTDIERIFGAAKSTRFRQETAKGYFVHHVVEVGALKSWINETIEKRWKGAK